MTLTSRDFYFDAWKPFCPLITLINAAVKPRFSRRAHTAVLFIIQLVNCCRNISRLLRNLIALPETCRESSLCQDRSRSTSPPWQPCQKASQALYFSLFHVLHMCLKSLCYRNGVSSWANCWSMLKAMGWREIEVRCRVSDRTYNRH